jgi:hypothetical protein
MWRCFLEGVWYVSDSFLASDTVIVTLAACVPYKYGLLWGLCMSKLEFWCSCGQRCVKL